MSQTRIPNVDEHGTFTSPDVLDRLGERFPGAGPEFFAKLDMRAPTEIVIAHASDSTGDQATEYFEAAWKATLASTWPERPARLKRWVLASNAYGSWTEWQAGDVATTTDYPPVFTDDFNRADSVDGSLGSGWAVNTAFKIAGNKLTMNPSVGATVLLGTGAAPTADHRVSARIATGSGSSTGLVIRALDSNNYYGARINATGNILLYKVIGGVTTSINGLDLGWPGDGAALMMESAGGQVRVYVNGTQILAGTAGDAALVNAYGYGVRGASGSVVPTWDDYAVTGITTATTTTVPTVTVYNGAAAGHTAQYQRGRLAEMYPVRPDVLFVNHGHNYTTPGDIDGFLASVQGLVDDLRTLYPGDPIPVVVTSQNPQFGTGREADHQARMGALRAYSKAQGWGYIPTYEAFAARADGGADQLTDGIHPAEGTGRALTATTTEAWLREQSRRP